MNTITVSLGERSYDIHAGPALLEQAGALVSPVLKTKKLFVVTDENVEKLHLETLKASFDAAGLSHKGVVLPAGEYTKDFPHLESLLSAMLDAGCERSTTIVAFGGGVIGDLTGFSASILLRGAPFIQIPTTLLSQVDSSVGGKTGINMAQGKNLVGSFYQPQMVLADIGVLATLPARELKSGYAEVVKYGLLGDASFFDWLDEKGEALLKGDVALRQQAVIACCKAKALIVAEDEKEGGVRAHLNLGHTFAHIFEAEAGYSGILNHGEAVSIGLVMAFELSSRLGLCPKGDADRVRNHLDRLGMPVRPPSLPSGKWNVDRLFERLSADKKIENGRVAFVLPRKIGDVFSSRDVVPEQVRALIAEFVDV